MYSTYLQLCPSFSLSAMDHIDLTLNSDDDNPPEFQKEKWIGQGLKLPSDTIPLELRIYIRQLSSLSASDKALLLPNPYLTFLELAERSNSLPLRDSNLVHKSVQHAFDKASPNVQLAWLKTRDLPTKTFVRKAEEALGQAILDGCLSIRDPRSDGARLPLPAISYWSTMHQVLDAEEERDRARLWLLRILSRVDVETEGQARRAISCLDALPWGAQTMIPGAIRANAITIAVLLSSGKVSTNTVNMMVHWIMARVAESEELTSQFEILGLELWNKIEQAEGSEAFADPEKLPGFVKRLRDRLQNTTKTLLFPVFVKDLKHFVAIKVDFDSKTFSYGERYQWHLRSMNRVLPTHRCSFLATGDTLHHLGFQLPNIIPRKIRFFLDGVFGEHFDWTGCSLAHGKQDDYQSCGVGAANIIAAAVLGERLFTHEQRVHHRITWFLRLAEADQALVYKSYFIHLIGIPLTFRHHRDDADPMRNKQAEATMPPNICQNQLRLFQEACPIS